MDIETISNVNGSYNAESRNSTLSEVNHEQVASTGSDSSSVLVSRKKEDVDLHGGDQQKEPSQKTIDQTVSQTNSKLEHTRCEYSYHEETNRVSIKVIDLDTDKVIREIPPEKTLDMLQKMWEMAGMMVDEKR